MAGRIEDAKPDMAVATIEAKKPKKKGKKA